MPLVERGEHEPPAGRLRERLRAHQFEGAGDGRLEVGVGQAHEVLRLLEPVPQGVHLGLQFVLPLAGGFEFLNHNGLSVGVEVGAVDLLFHANRVGVPDAARKLLGELALNDLRQAAQFLLDRFRFTDHRL